MSTADHEFCGERLLEIVRRLPDHSSIWVGFSGGADSTALLHALHELRGQLGVPLKAVHFHHGLHEDAESWLNHCRAFCSDRSIPFFYRSLDVARLAQSNIEAVARNLRYRAILDFLKRDEVYLTAHHADDQAETVFLNLMRGSGNEGIAGIPELRKLGEGWVARPLLNWKRVDRERYLEKHRLAWKQDPSNADTSFDRNFLRNELLPTIEARWPGLTGRLNRSARIARLTSEALANFINAASGDLLGSPHRMPLTPLLELELAMQTLVLRQWLRLQEIQSPPEVRLLEFLDQLAEAHRENQAELRWQHWQVKRYRDFLWLQDTSVNPVCPKKSWYSGTVVELDQHVGRLQLYGNPTSLPDGWEVDCRREGAQIRLSRLASRQALKDCFRQARIPPWLRTAIPVLYWDDEPVAIGDWLVAGKLKEWLTSNSLKLVWHPAHPMLKDLRQNWLK